MSHPAAISDPATSAPPPRTGLPADPVFGLLDRLADHLAPLFVTDPADLPTGRIMAVRTIASYRPETQADFINVGRAISFSMSALAALSRAASPDMPPALQLRYLARANALNRSADQSERAIERRRRFQQATPPPAHTAGMAQAAERMAEPDTAPKADPPHDTASQEAAIKAAVAEAVRDHAAGQQPAKPRLATTGGPPLPDPSPALRTTHATAASPNPPARPAAPHSAASHAGAVPLRQPTPGPLQKREQELMRGINSQLMQANRPGDPRRT